MGLLSRLQRILDPRWERGYSYDLKGVDELHVVITRGWHCSKEFILKDVKFKEGSDDYLDFEVKHVIGRTPKRIIVIIFNQLLKEAIDNYNQLHGEVLNDTEDSGADYIEEPVDERRVRTQGPSVPQE